MDGREVLLNLITYKPKKVGKLRKLCNHIYSIEILDFFSRVPRTDYCVQGWLCTDVSFRIMFRELHFFPFSAAPHSQFPALWLLLTVQPYVVPFASTRSTSQSFLASTPLITKNNVLVHPAGSTRPIDSLEWDNEENNRLVRIFVYEVFCGLTAQLPIERALN